MQWDLGLQGLGLLVLMSLGFGVIAQLIGGKAITRWLWLIATGAYFVAGLFISEVWFGWATGKELQPTSTACRSTRCSSAWSRGSSRSSSPGR